MEFDQKISFDGILVNQRLEYVRMRIKFFLYNMCRPNEINSSKIFVKYDGFYNDTNVNKTRIINKMK